MMWRSGQTPLATPKTAPEPIRSESATPVSEYSNGVHAVPAAVEEATVGKGMFFKGTITGNGPLIVEGEVVGNINLPEGRVIVGPTGRVSDGLSVCIKAREIVIMGRIRGNISASDRVEICAQGTLIGNVSAARISIADCAYFKGDIALRSVQPKPAVSCVHEEEVEQRQAYA